MRIKTKIAIFSIVVGIVLFLLWYSGIIDTLSAALSAIIGIFVGHSTYKKKAIEEEQERVRKRIRELKKAKLKMEFQRNLHDEEVKRVNEKDYSNMSIDELIVHANERESKRADKAD